MSRVLVLCCRPMHLSAESAETWLRTEVGVLLAGSAVAQIRITTLVSASSTWGRAWDYLIAIDLDDGASARDVVNTDACANLLGDLRLLGMYPNVVVVDDARTVVLGREQS